MTKRYPLRGAFCGGNSGDAGDFEGIALGIFEAADGCYYFRLHFYEGVGFGGARSYFFGGDVDHLHFAAGGVVRKSWHRLLYANKSTESTESLPAQTGTEVAERMFQITSFRSSIGTVSPTSTRLRSAATTKKQFARAKAAMSPEPCQGRAFTSGVAPRHSTLAGRKCVRPGFSFRGAPRCASTSGRSRAVAPLSKSIAGTAKSSNVTMVETGLPGSPKTNVFPHFPNTAGFPGRMATASK